MKKMLFSACVSVALVLSWAEIAVGVALGLQRGYENLSEHWLAGALVCILSAGVVTFFPMCFLAAQLNDSRQRYPFNVNDIVGMGAIGGIAGGFFGLFEFLALGKILGVLLLCTTGSTMLRILEAFRGISSELDRAEKESRDLRFQIDMQAIRQHLLESEKQEEH